MSSTIQILKKSVSVWSNIVQQYEASDFFFER